MLESRMMRIIGAAIVPAVLVLVTIPAMATSVTYDGVTFPGGNQSFADKVVKFTPGADTVAPYDDPAQALGPPDYDSSQDTGYVSLGVHGTLDLAFTDNALTTSGDSADDLWVFEIGSAVEPTDVWVSTDGSTWISVGYAGGATDGVDLDAYIGSGITAGAKYSYVRLQDKNGNDSYPFAGADIDAVGAIASTAVPHPSVPEPNGLALLTLGVALIGGMSAWRRYSGR